MRRVRIILNPSAGGGRAARILPELERALTTRGLSHRVDRTTGIDHARELAAAAAAEGEIAAACGGDGLVGAVAGGLRGTEGVLAILPGGRGNDLARVLGIPDDPAAAVDVLADGEPQPLDLAQVGDRVFCCIGSCGFDSDANRIANETTRLKGNSVYLYAALRALAGWRPARFELVLDGEPTAFTGWTVAVANSKAYGGGMFIAPGASLTDGRLDVVTIAETSKATFLRRLPKVFKGKHVDEDEVTVRQAREVRDRRRPPLRALRRRRSGRPPAGDHPRAARRRARPAARGTDGAVSLGLKVAAARAAGTLARRTGRGGTSLPGKLLMRMEPGAIGELAGRLPQGSTVISATNGKTTTAAMAASILERARHAARAQPRRREHGRRRRLHPARRRPARRHRRRPRPLRGRRVLARERLPTSSTRGCCCWPTSSATSSTATASSTRSPTAGPRSSRAATGARPSCSAPTTRPSPTWAATGAT